MQTDLQKKNMVGSAFYRYLARERLRDTPQAFPGQFRLTSLMLRTYRTVKTAYGPRIVAHGQDWTNLAAASGHYGEELISLIRSLPKDSLFLDIGANLGIFSLLASRHLSNGRVLSFEPNPRVFDDFRQNIRLNQCENITAHNYGISDTTHCQTLWVDPRHTGAGSLRERSTGSIEIKLVAASEAIAPVLAHHNGRVLCKIDTEGAESHILTALAKCGALDALQQIYLEIDQAHLEEAGSSEEDVYHLMTSSGFDAQYDRRGRPHYDQLFVKH